MNLPGKSLRTNGPQIFLFSFFELVDLVYPLYSLDVRAPVRTRGLM